jgi:hypothetical protein
MEGTIQNGYQITEGMLKRLKLSVPEELYEIWLQAYQEGKQYTLVRVGQEMQIRFI